MPVIQKAASLDVGSWREEALEEARWRQPPGVFLKQAAPGGVDLWSEVVVDAPHGQVDPGYESRHWFRAEVRWVEGALPEAICKAVPHYFSLIYGEESSPGALEAFTVDGRKAWKLFSGIHGYDGAHYFVELGPRRTLAITVYTIGGSILEGSFQRRHRKIREQQEAIRDRMIASIRFESGQIGP
jgi:hypothetical protein